MTAPDIDRWASRDLPFLRHVVPILDDEPRAFLALHTIADALGMSDEAAYASAKALEDAGLITFQGVMPAPHSFVKSVSAEARRIIGVWPSEQLAADRLIEAVRALADDEALPLAERTRWQAIRDGLTAAGRDLVVQVASGVITGQIPH